MDSDNSSWANIVSKNSYNLETINRIEKTKCNKTVNDINYDVYDDEWDEFNEMVGYKINKEILNEVSLLREEVYLLDKMHSGLLEDFFINHISVLENICDQSSEEFISSTDEEDFI